MMLPFYTKRPDAQHWRRSGLGCITWSVLQSLERTYTWVVAPFPHTIYWVNSNSFHTRPIDNLIQDKEFLPPLVSFLQRGIQFALLLYCMYCTVQKAWPEILLLVVRSLFFLHWQCCVRLITARLGFLSVPHLCSGNYSSLAAYFFVINCSLPR